VNKEFVAAINQVCHDRQLPKEVVLEAVESALVSAYRRKYGTNQGISARVDSETGDAQIFTHKLVVDTVTDDKREVGLQEARRRQPEAVVGDEVPIETTPENFGRIAAQTARQVILQRIREAERDSLFNTYAEREGEIINGTVQSIDQQQVTLSLGKVEAILPRPEQMPTERYSIGQRLRAFVSEVQKTPRGPLIIVSRTHRNMLRRLLELEVPEIFNGTVEIKAIAREAGYRSKVAVNALQEGVDPVGSCVGMRGVRIQSIVNELNGEKIDVVAWSPDTASLIANSLSPAKVLNVILDDDSSDKTATVVVPDKQLSLAIGKEGQNARLAAKLTNWRIDIKSVTEAATEALSRVTNEDDLRQATVKDHDILAIASEILKEKEGIQLSDGELQALSRAIQIVRDAEVALNKDRAAARLRMAIVQAMEAQEPSQPRPRPEESVDLLSRAEAILAARDAEQAKTGIQPTTPTEPGVLPYDVEPAFEQETAQPASLPHGTETIHAGESTPGEAVPAPAAELALTAPEQPGAEPAAPEASLPAQAVPEAPAGWEEEEGNGEEARTDKKKKGRGKKRELVFDDKLGEVVTHRRRKPSRQRGKWEDYF
jgi:N utilization substance protein A